MTDAIVQLLLDGLQTLLRPLLLFLVFPIWQYTLWMLANMLHVIAFAIYVPMVAVGDFIKTLFQFQNVHYLLQGAYVANLYAPLTELSNESFYALVTVVTFRLSFGWIFK